MAVVVHEHHALHDAPHAELAVVCLHALEARGGRLVLFVLRLFLRAEGVVAELVQVHRLRNLVEGRKRQRVQRGKARRRNVGRGLLNVLRV